MTVKAPMERIAASGSELVIGKDGPGALYYRVGMSLIPSDQHLGSLDHGFLVERNLRGLSDLNDVTRSASGDWQIKAGAEVEVELTFSTSEARDHVALLDSLPAGLELLHPELDQTSPRTGGNDVWWFDHQNLKEQRVEVFSDHLPQGVYTYRYLAKATSSGEFAWPPCRAEETYSPETHGRNASTRLVVRTK